MNLIPKPEILREDTQLLHTHSLRLVSTSC